MAEPKSSEPDQMVASERTLEVVVALILLMLAGIVIYDSIRIGIGWLPAQGPASGYFPFYVAVGLAGASVVNLFQALRHPHKGQTAFIVRSGLGRLLAVLLPLALYVALIGYLGVYVSAIMLIFGFMILIGGEPWQRSIITAVAVPAVAFFMFEKWFLVPLPKGPLEAAFGY